MSTEFRTLNDIVRAFHDIGERHLQIKTFFVGQDFDLGNDTARNSILAVNPISAVLPKTDGGYTSYAVDFTVKVLDLVNKDMSNELEVLSDGLEILKDIVSELNTHPYYIESSFDIIGDVSFEPARGVFDSDLTGWECTFTLEAPNYRYFCGLPMDALNGQTYYPDLFSNIRNSDDTYNTTVIVSETLTLPDITHTDSDLSPVTLPAQTPMVCTPGGGASPSGIAYDIISFTGVEVSYRTGDDKDIQDNDSAASNPVYPVSYAIQDKDATNPFITLLNNNSYGGKERFTSELGNQTYTNNLIIDHLTGLMWHRVVVEQVTWNTAIDDCQSSTQGGFSDWYLPSRADMDSIIREDSNNSYLLNYSPFNISGTTRKWLSTTALSSSLSADVLLATGIGIRAKTLTENYFMVRKHLI